MKVTRDKNCYCHTCEKDFHYLGITQHRAGHRRRKEDRGVFEDDMKKWLFQDRYSRVDAFVIVVLGIVVHKLMGIFF